jgi:hypothetical protein
MLLVAIGISWPKAARQQQSFQHRDRGSTIDVSSAYQCLKSTA